MAGVQEIKGWGTGNQWLGLRKSEVAAREISGWGTGDQWLGHRKSMVGAQEISGWATGNQWLWHRKSVAGTQEISGWGIHRKSMVGGSVSLYQGVCGSVSLYQGWGRWTPREPTHVRPLTLDIKAGGRQE